MWNRLSLRLRVTLLCALCLVAICAMLTLSMIRRAGVSYGGTVQDMASLVIMDTAKTVPSIPAAQVIPAYNALPLEALDVMLSTTNAQYAASSLWVMAGIAVLGILLIWLIAGRTLRPVRDICHQIERIDETNLAQPIVVRSGGREVSAIARAFNGMMARVSSAYDAQRRFAQNAAHELKTPVASVLATIEVAEMDESPTSGDLQRALTRIEKDTRRMASLIEDMLALNAAGNPESYTDIPARAMMEAILEALRPEADEKRIAVTIGGDAMLHGNRALLGHAFANIVHNAIRYNREGGWLRIQIAPERIMVEDNGIGIDKEALPRVTEPFFCADPSHSRSVGGSGLGLSISRQIFQQHGMDMRIASEEGTRVTVFTNRSSNP